MIHRVIELSTKRACEIMVPLDEIVSVSHDTKVDQFFEVARKANLTRIPVRDGDGAFVGVVNVFYVLSVAAESPETPISAFMRRPLVVPGDMPVDDILPRMRRFRQPLCLVNGGAGEVAGLITTEDVLEEIVGEL